MIDTIKLFIPIENTDLLLKLKGTLSRFRKENLKTNEVNFEFYSSQVELGSYDRNVNVMASNVPQGFFVEFSVPKYLKDSNVEMIKPEELNIAIPKLYTELCKHMDYNLPHYSTWPVYRLDTCYNWIFENGESATRAIDFIKLIDFPRKKKHIWDTSVMFKGTAYTIKFYLKGPEFLKNDFKKVKDRNHVHTLQHWANRMLRFEIGIRKQHLQDFLGQKPVLLEHISDYQTIEEILRHYLDLLFRYLNKKTMTNEEIKESLFALFTPQKATRLYDFYQNFYFNPEMKQMYLRGGLNRSTIYRYKKDLERAEIGLSSDLIEGNTQILEKFKIPSSDAKFDLPAPEYYS
jgi:II/X family phage/plasmid replication protein